MNVQVIFCWHKLVSTC